MPPNSFARLLTPTALGAALLGLSATLFAVDVGGTVALDAPSAPPPNAPPSAQGAPAEQSLVAENNNGPDAGSLAGGLPPPAVPAVPAAAPARDRAVAAPAAPAHPAPAHPAVIVAAKVPAPAAALPHGALPAVHAAIARHAVAEKPQALALRMAPPASTVIHSASRTAAPPRIAVVLPAPAAPRAAANAAPAREALADLRDVRHYAMGKLLEKYPNLSVISADTYPVGNGRVRVAMVVRNGNQRWIEKDDVRRNGTKLALLGSKRRAMPYTVAQSSPLAPDRNPGP
jgi:hypothetical protein